MAATHSSGVAPLPPARLLRGLSSAATAIALWWHLRRQALNLQEMVDGETDDSGA
jgi:uncharacterized protein YjiS (DUF1127 family)